MSAQRKNRNRTVNSKKKSKADYHEPDELYVLPPVLGYDNHCHTRFRNPAFSITSKHFVAEKLSDGPGPIYNPEFPKGKHDGFSLGAPWRPLRSNSDQTPGFYDLSPYRPTPVFTIKSRVKQPRYSATDDVPFYDPPNGLNGPSFSLGKRFSAIITKDEGPSLILVNDDFAHPRAPSFSLGPRLPTLNPSTRSRLYNPVEPKRGPSFSFGIRHSPHILPCITPLDNKLTIK